MEPESWSIHAIPDGPLATNKHIAKEIFAKCYLMELDSAPSFKVGPSIAVFIAERLDRI